MKKVWSIVAVLAVTLFAAGAFAAGMDGDYSFVSRTKAGKADLAGWTGNMKIANGTMARDFKSADGKETKFYESTMKNEGGDLYALKFTKAYKPEYVGTEHKNNLVLKDGTLTVSAPDGSFNEVWKKK